MPSNEFLEITKRIIRERPEMFEALMEFERTKRLPKTKYKVRANFTVDAHTLRQFRSYCEKNGLNMSKVIEKSMRERLRK